MPNLADGASGYLEAASRPAANTNRERAILQSVPYLDGSDAISVYDRQRMVWFSQLWSLLIQVERYPPQYSQLLAHAMMASKRPVLRLYGRLMLFRQESACRSELPGTKR